MRAFSSPGWLRRPVVVAALVLVAGILVWVGIRGGSAETEASGPEDVSTGAVDAPTPAEPLQCERPITVGVVTDLSGGLGVHGVQLARGVSAGFAYQSGTAPQTGADQSYVVDECEVRVLIRDDQSNPDVAALLSQQLVDDEGAVILIGSVSPGTTSVLRDLAHDRGVILVATSDTPTGLEGPDFDPNSFLVAPTVFQDAMATCEYWTGLDRQTGFAQIAQDYPLGQRAAAAFRDACTTYGGEFVVGDILAPAETSEFASLLAQGSSADVMLVTWTGGGLGQLLTDAAASNVSDVSTPFPSNALVPLWFGDAVGATSSIAYHYTAPSNEINDFLVSANAASGTRPDLHDAHGMNAALMAIQGLRVARGDTDANALRTALEGLRFAGPTGLAHVRVADHISIRDVYVATLLNTSDLEQRYYEIVAVIRPEPPCMLEADLATRCGDLPIGSLGG